MGGGRETGLRAPLSCPSPPCLSAFLLTFKISECCENLPLGSLLGRFLVKV